MRGAFLLSALILCGCGSGNMASIGSPPPVQASSGFTNASLAGSYAFGSSYQTGSGPATSAGVFTSDGAGNLNGGEETANVAGVHCHATFTGTYSVSANGTVTGQINPALDPQSISNGCTSLPTNLIVILADGGQNLIFELDSPYAVGIGTAERQ